MMRDFKSMSNLLTKPGVFKHVNCRGGIYPRSNVARFVVPDSCIFWSEPFPEYSDCPIYTIPNISEKPWADPDIESTHFKPLFNQIDGLINRISHMGRYQIKNGYPLNPIGRTGLRGRGALGRWGPNHAADSIVTRWLRDADGNCVKNQETQLNLVEMIAIKRRDNQMWAMPGGMTNVGEQAEDAAKREFIEEALNCKDDRDMLEGFFSEGVNIYEGYVDDPRNTDNAWIETVAINFHDDCGDITDKLILNAGDDAADAKWIKLDRSLCLYANHLQFIKLVVERLNCHW